MRQESLKKVLENNGGMIVSEGTLRAEDMFQTLRYIIEKYEEFDSKKLKHEFDLGEELIEKIEQEDDNYYQDVLELNDIVYLLEDHVTANTPEGFCWGTAEGDGACFGFFCACPRCTDMEGCEESEADKIDQHGMCWDCKNYEHFDGECPYCYVQ